MFKRKRVGGTIMTKDEIDAYKQWWEDRHPEEIGKQKPGEDVTGADTDRSRS